VRDPVGGGAVEMSKLRLLDLFSGIGGFSLGLERSGGFETVAFCEIEDFPRRVLAKHWPKVPCYHDIRELTADRLAADGIAVDAICGGFPCQDISNAGKQAGIEGERSGLWSEYARLIGELRPRVVFVENVSALLGRGLDRVLGDLAALGYDAWWDCIPASALGAPHQRDRFWLVAYPSGVMAERANTRTHLSQVHSAGRRFAVVANGADVSDAFGKRQPGQGQFVNASHPAPNGGGQAANVVDGSVGNQWKVEPDVGRVANGVSYRLDRLKGLGNAVVPQIPELLGRAWMEANHV
jgi:DNA (cytosine-5)-methyltransferase 1